jgi:hypothetical protein
MLLAVSADEVERSTVPRDSVPNERNSGSGVVLESGNYFGNNQVIGRGPQGFFVHFGPNFHISPHFHRVDQYQIVVRGSGRIGKHELSPVSVHYADGFTPYGPIECGPEGMAFFNLRSHSDTGAYPMPASREALERRAGRARTEHTAFRLTDEVHSLQMRALIELQPDGLATYEVLAGPGVELVSEVAGGACRYQLVLDGSLEVGSKLLPKDSCVFASAGEVLSGHRAGPAGVHVLEVQLPYA